jgi:hypothetical protein
MAAPPREGLFSFWTRENKTQILFRCDERLEGGARKDPGLTHMEDFEGFPGQSRLEGRANTGFAPTKNVVQ